MDPPPLNLRSSFFCSCRGGGGGGRSPSSSLLPVRCSSAPGSRFVCCAHSAPSRRGQSIRSSGPCWSNCRCADSYMLSPTPSLSLSLSASKHGMASLVASRGSCLTVVIGRRVSAFRDGGTEDLLICSCPEMLRAGGFQCSLPVEHLHAEPLAEAEKLSPPPPGSLLQVSCSNFEPEISCRGPGDGSAPAAGISPRVSWRISNVQLCGLLYSSNVLIGG